MKYPSRQSGLFFHGFRVSYKIRFKSFEVKKFFCISFQSIEQQKSINMATYIHTDVDISKNRFLKALLGICFYLYSYKNTRAYFHVLSVFIKCFWRYSNFLEFQKKKDIIYTSNKLIFSTIYVSKTFQKSKSCRVCMN